VGRRFIQLELDITNRCNLRCVMCFHSLAATRHARTVHLTPDDFSRAAAPVLPLTQRLSLSLGNEPLMSPHFAAILRVAAPYKVPHVNFYTNGLLLNDVNTDAIIKYGVTQVCVSIDGATRTTYNAIRRDGDFDDLVRNVEHLIARRDAHARRLPRVRFDIVMMQRNVHELPDIVRLASRLGVQELNFRHLVSFEGLNIAHESLTHRKALSNYYLDKALALATDLGLETHHHPAPFELDNRKFALRPDESTPGPEISPYCSYPFYFITMGPGGHVLPCPHAHGEAPYGQVSPSTPLDQIWLGPRFVALRTQILANDPPGMCRRCPLLADRHPDVGALFVTRRH